MSALTDFIAVLRGWVDRGDIDESVVTLWIRMGEERINNELIYKDMLDRQQATFIDNCFPLPSDWISVKYVRYVRSPTSTDINIRRGRPFDFISNDDYWDRTRNDNYTAGPCYTIIGNDLFVTGNIDTDNPVDIQIGVYCKVPPLDGPNWLYNNHLSLYTFASLAASAPYLVEDERMAMWEGKATQLISQMNERHLIDKNGGSPMKRKFKSFG